MTRLESILRCYDLGLVAASSIRFALKYTQPASLGMCRFAPRPDNSPCPGPVDQCNEHPDHKRGATFSIGIVG